MSKIALITDQHFGGKQDGQHFMDYIERFYTNQFFPYLKENNITTVIDLGDTFDRRKYVNFHTTYYRNTNHVNSSDLLYGHYSNVSIYSKPCTIYLSDDPAADVQIDLIPWINSENYDATMKFIKNSKSQILFGHLEIDGFAMYKGYVADSGLSKKIFNRYEVVCSGHYHHKSSKNNIHYLGAPYEITWNDYDDPRGFHVFDTETRELTFIQNLYRLFEKIYYDDENWSRDFRTMDTNYYKNKIVKLIVENKTRIPEFETFLDRLYKSNPIDLMILEDLSEYSMRYSEDEEEDLEVGNTSTFLNEYVDSMPDDNVKDEERKKVKRLLQVIYDEALNIDD